MRMASVRHTAHSGVVQPTLLSTSRGIYFPTQQPVQSAVCLIALASKHADVEKSPGCRRSKLSAVEGGPGCTSIGPSIIGSTSSSPVSQSSTFLGQMACFGAEEDLERSLSQETSIRKSNTVEAM